MKRVTDLCLSVCVLLSGCYGGFNLTRKLHKWNGEVGSKWTNEGVFLGLALLNVYTFSALGDLLIFNTVEFWSGKNPVNAGTLRLSRDGGSVVASDVKTGRLVGSARVEDGRAVVSSPSGAVVRRLSPQDLE